MTNADFEKIVDTSDEWIVTRTGIRERHVADASISCSDMAVQAATRAMEMAGCGSDDIDLVICGTVTPDYRVPSNACVMQEKMGLRNAVAFDQAAACTAFINGISIANAFLSIGQYKKALVIGVEKLTSITNYADRGTCVLFGDAAGSVVMEQANDGHGVVSTFVRSDGSLREWLWIPVGGSKTPITPEFTFDGSDKLYMNGSEIFKVAVREMVNATKRVIKDAGLTPDDIALFVPHQANIRIVEAMVKRLGVSMDKVYLNIERYGNTSSASIPLALDEANRKGMIKPGDNVVMVAFGGGLIWGAALVKW
jgi:3-oxoacyl-[acyl-carrier-protein] synthase-3